MDFTLQLSLASYHYQQNHYQEATDIYKRLLIANREFLALQVHIYIYVIVFYALFFNLC